MDNHDRNRLLSTYTGVTDLLTKLHRKQKGRVADTISGEFRVRRGQGCVLSPSLFNILAEMVICEALDGFEGEMQSGGRRVTNLRYANDAIMLVASESELQEMNDRMERACKKYELEINSGKK